MQVNLEKIEEVRVVEEQRGHLQNWIAWEHVMDPQRKADVCDAKLQGAAVNRKAEVRRQRSAGDARQARQWCRREGVLIGALAHVLVAVPGTARTGRGEAAECQAGAGSPGVGAGRVCPLRRTASTQDWGC